MPGKTRVLVLGGGPGGVVVAHRLRKWGRDLVDVTLVDKEEYHEFKPSYLWVMTGNREPSDVRRPLASFAGRNGVKFVRAEVTEIRPGDRLVKTSNGLGLEYDYLVVALGSTPGPQPKGTCSPWTLEGAVACRRALAELRSNNPRILVGPSSPVYKCPPAPFETAFLIKYVLEQRGLSPSITVFHEWREPMEPYGPTMVSMFKSMLDAYNVGFVGGASFKGVDPGRSVVLTSAGDMEYDLAIVVPPYHPPKPVKESELSGGNGYMRVRIPTMKSHEYDDVYGIGDVVAPSLGLGMAGVFAHFQGEYVATQIIDEVKGAYLGEHYNMSGVCVMDLGYVGAAVYCDFTDVVLGRSRWPRCMVVGGARIFRFVKAAFERQWFTSFFGG